MPCRVVQQAEAFADLAAVPDEDRAGEAGRRGGVAVVVGGVGQDAVGYRAAEFVAQSSQGLQVRGERLIPQVVRQLRPGQD